MKKLLCLLLAILLAALLLSACGGKDDPTPDPVDPSGEGEDKPDEPADNPFGKPEDPEVLTIVKDGKSDYEIVYNAGTGDNTSTYAYSIQSKINKKTGVSLKMITTNVTRSEDKHYIFINCKRVDAVSAVKAGIGYGDCAYMNYGEDIVLTAYVTTVLESAANALGRLFANAADENGDIILEPFEKVETKREGYENVPVIDPDVEPLAYNAGGGSVGLQQERSKKADFDEYCKKLESLGFVKNASSVKGNVTAATYVGKENVLYVTLQNKKLQVISMAKADAFLPDSEEPDFTKVCDSKGYMLGVTKSDFENGMSFVYQLADGTFLVFDGGQGSVDAAHLHQVMEDLALKAGLRKIVITAWVVTHAHNDHVGVFAPFFEAYGREVEVKTLFINPTTADMGESGGAGGYEDSVRGDVLRYNPDAKVRSLHTGQDFWLCDVNVHVMYAVEDLTPGDFTDYNSCSTVLQLTGPNGKTVLMTGDCSFPGWEVIVDNYGTALKSDILQVPHHGAHLGGTVEAYDLILPETLLWPCGRELYDKDLTPWNAYYKTNEHLLALSTVKHSYIAGGYKSSATDAECLTPFDF